ncbi:GNAT family protein [soil metagenome]
MSDEQLPEIITTHRLVLRPYLLSDVDAVLAHAADPEWARYLPVPIPYQRLDAEQFIARQILLDRSRNPAWAITWNAELVGGINVRIDRENRVAEMGYSTSRPVWGLGIASEAAHAALDSVFRSLPVVNRVRAMADPRNLASQRVMEKIGMRREGVLRQNRVVRGEAVDELWFGVLRTEWSA